MILLCLRISGLKKEGAQELEFLLDMQCKTRMDDNDAILCWIYLQRRTDEKLEHSAESWRRPREGKEEEMSTRLVCDIWIAFTDLKNVVCAR